MGRVKMEMNDFEMEVRDKIFEVEKNLNYFAGFLKAKKNDAAVEKIEEFLKFLAGLEK
jgi:hypothetical protein